MEFKIERVAYFQMWKEIRQMIEQKLFSTNGMEKKIKDGL